MTRSRTSAPLGGLGVNPLVSAAGRTAPAATLEEFVRRARGRDFSHGSHTVRSTGHVFAQLFPGVAQLGMANVGDLGEAPMLTDMLGGRVQYGIVSTISAKGHMREGRIRGLAALGGAAPCELARGADLPRTGLPAGVRTGRVRRAGGAGPEAAGGAGAAHRGIPRRDATPGSAEWLAELDVVPGWAGPDEIRADIAARMRQWTDLVRRTGITAE